MTPRLEFEARARCYVEPAQWTAETVRLDREESHHLGYVLRSRCGQRVEVFNGCGGEGEARILALEPDGVTLSIVSRSTRPRPAVALSLIQALPRERKMELIIQKATELGVETIVPVVAEHSLVKLDADRAGGRLARWTSIALSAAKQSHAAWLPVIESPQPLAGYLAGRPAFDLLLVGSLAPGARRLRDALAEAKRRGVRRLGVVIGPEGDLTPTEAAAAQAAGAVPVTFGRSVLRVETAALFALSVLRYEFEG